MSEGGDSSSSTSCSSPEQRSESRGSSVSARLREEYEDLLKYAVVAPKLSDGGVTPPPTLPPSLSTEVKACSEEESPSLPSQLPTPPHPTSPPPHPSLHHVSHSPSPPSSPHPHFTMAQEPSRPQNPTIPDSHTRSNGSHDQGGDITQTSRDRGDDVGMDPEVARLEIQLDTWCLELKRNVLAEFEQARLRVLESRQREMEGQLQQQAYAMRQVQEEVERYKELVATFETSVARKDQLIASLTASLEKQKSRVELQKSFSTWKIQRHDDQREAFTSALARCHYHSHLQSRVWEAWFGVIRERWKQRVERACQTKAEEVCVKLTTDYDERLAVSQRALDDAHQEIQQLKAEKNVYEQNMKQAFMRGVCALNMEAMTMFRQSDSVGDHGNGLAPPTGDEEDHSDGQESDTGGNPSLDLSRHPPHLPPSQSAPFTHHHGNQIHPPHIQPSHLAQSTCFYGNQPPHSSQEAQFTPHPIPTTHAGHVTTSSVQIKKSQPNVKSSTMRGHRSVGVATRDRKKGCGHPKPAIMVERHVLE